MLNSLDQKLPDLLLVRGRPIQENLVNCPGEPSSQCVFNFGVRPNGFRGSRVELRPLRGLAPLDRLRRSPALRAGRVKSRRPD